MSRHPWVLADAAFYHVSNRTARGESRFLDPEEAAAFVGRVLEARVRHGIAVFAWCLMSNHFHLVLRPGPDPLWRSLALIQQCAGRDLDGAASAGERPWKCRCTVRPIRRRRALDHTVAYVHLNPVAAGLTDDPAGYRWSGHRELAGLEEPCVTDAGLALARFAASPEAAHRAYLELVRRERPGIVIGVRVRP